MALSHLHETSELRSIKKPPPPTHFFFFSDFNVILMRAYTHGGWSPRQRLSTTFFTQKTLSQTFLVLLTRGSNLGSFDLESRDALPTEPRRHPQHNEFFPRVENVLLTLCRCACPTPKNDHVLTLKIMSSMSEFGGLQKHEKTQPACTCTDDCRGSATYSASLRLLFNLTQVWRPEFHGRG